MDMLYATHRRQSYIKSNISFLLSQYYAPIVITPDVPVVPDVSHEEGGFTRTLSEIKLGASNHRRPITSGPIKKHAYKLPQNN